MSLIYDSSGFMLFAIFQWDCPLWWLLIPPVLGWFLYEVVASLVARLRRRRASGSSTLRQSFMIW
jgi:hypothetical protein